MVDPNIGKYAMRFVYSFPIPNIILSTASYAGIAKLRGRSKQEIKASSVYCLVNMVVMQYFIQNGFDILKVRNDLSLNEAFHGFLLHTAPICLGYWAGKQVDQNFCFKDTFTLAAAHGVGLMVLGQAIKMYFQTYYP